MGGASRFMMELRVYLKRTAHNDIVLLGDGHSLTTGWLIRRELAAANQHPRAVVALNNVSFVAAGLHRTVLLRNALHFPLPGEQLTLPPAARYRIAAEARIARTAIRRADLVVVPASSMAARVSRWVPEARTRIAVRPHPVSPRSVNGGRVPGRIVCPVLLAPWKGLGKRLALCIDACSRIRAAGIAVELVVTATEKELAQEGISADAVTAVGRRDVREMEELLATAHVVYFPTAIESFGYPLAEARANGQPVLALANSHNAEVAGNALVGFEPNVGSLEQAIWRSLELEVTPSVVSTPDEYFNLLLEAL